MKILSSLLRKFVEILAVASVVIFIFAGMLISELSRSGAVLGIIAGGIVGIVFAVVTFGIVAVFLNIEENTENTARDLQAILKKLESQPNLPRVSTTDREQEKATLATSPSPLKPSEPVKSAHDGWRHNGYDIKKIDDNLIIVGVDVGDKSFRFVADAKHYIETNLPDKSSDDDNA